MKFDMELTSLIVSGLQDMCALKASHISFYVHDGLLSLGSISPEFFKMIPRNLPVTCEDISFRLPKGLLQVLLTPSVLHFEIESNVSVTQFINGKLSLKVTAPFELDFNDELFSSVREQQALPHDSFEIAPLLVLRDLVQLSKVGVQFDDTRAFIIGNGFQVYRQTNLAIKFVATQDCLKNLLRMSKGGTTCTVYGVMNYVVFENTLLLMGWLGSRESVCSEYSLLKSQSPVYESVMNLNTVRDVVKQVNVNKTNPPKCTLSVTDSKMYIESEMNTYSISITQSGESPDNCEDVSLDLKLLKDILAAVNTNLIKTTVRIYRTFVYLAVDSLEILIAREV